ncbi:MAG: hypothetical protein ABIQ29_08405 [Burkholderiaceae bacterium]
MLLNASPVSGLGITVMPEWFQCEGIESVLDRLQAAGATALATSPYLMDIVAEGQGAREPPPDGDAGDVRPLDRALWGRRQTWVRTAPSLTHDVSRYRGLRYQPSPQCALTEAQPRLIDDVIEAAARRGMAVYLQVMAASPPGYRVQFSSAIDDDLCIGPDFAAHPLRVDRNASLASPHVVDYGAALLAELAHRYPGVHGFRIDWPEYPPYDLRSALFDFSPHAHGALRMQGVEPSDYARLVLDRQQRWRLVARNAAVHGASAVRDALRVAHWDDFFGEHGDGAPLWASKRSAVATMLRRYRAALDDVPGPRKTLEPQVFPAPFTCFSGFDWSALTGSADAVGVKLYTMHWPMIARYWARDLVGSAETAHLDAVTAAMADFMGLCDGGMPDGRVLRYPPPELPHPAGALAQRHKIHLARAAAGDVPVITFAHAYGPADDVEHRLRIALDAGGPAVWINRYGYLSDDKLARVAMCMRMRQTARLP